MVGIGTDIVEFARVKKIRNLRRFAEYFLLPSEIETFDNAPHPIAFIASRFAAKEAVIKAFPGFLSPHDFEIIKAADGKKPIIKFVAPDKENRYRMLVSISHSTDYAAGYAIATIK